MVFKLYKSDYEIGFVSGHVMVQNIVFGFIPWKFEICHTMRKYKILFSTQDEVNEWILFEIYKNDRIYKNNIKSLFFPCLDLFRKAV